MQQVSELYTRLWRGNHTMLTRVDIAGETYLDDRISDCRISRQMASSALEVGKCIAAQIDLTIIPTDAEIPRRAEMRVYIALTDGTDTSEWVPQGVFYISTRQTVTFGGIKALSIHGFDCILMLEDAFYFVPFPPTMAALAQSIAARIGVSIDSRTVIGSYPVSYDPSLSMRQYMGYIAAAHGGNWIATPLGELRIVSAFDAPPESSLLISNYGDALVFGDTRIIV